MGGSWLDGWIVRRASTVVAVALVLWLPAPAGATGAPDRQDVDGKLTTDRAGEPTNSSMDMRFFDPANPGGKPYSVDKVVIESPPGLRLDHSALPQCNASEAELMARGEAACPPGSKVQSGRMVLDTGSPLLVPRLMAFRTVTFNADGGLVSIGEGENFVMRGVVRSRTHGNTVTVDYTDAPGFGGPDSRSAMKTMFTAGPALGSDSRPFMRTPTTCPQTGRWTTRYTFIYHDGVSQTETTSAPCRPRLALTRRCIGDGRLRVSLVGDPDGIRDVNFKFGKRLVARDTEPSFVRVIGRSALERTRARRLRAVVYLRGGPPLRRIVSRRLPRCGL